MHRPIHSTPFLRCDHTHWLPTCDLISCVLTMCLFLLISLKMHLISCKKWNVGVNSCMYYLLTFHLFVFATDCCVQNCRPDFLLLVNCWFGSPHRDRQFVIDGWHIKYLLDKNVVPVLLFFSAWWECCLSCTVVSFGGDWLFQVPEIRKVKMFSFECSLTTNETRIPTFAMLNRS